MFKRHLFSNGQVVKYRSSELELKFLLQLPWLHIRLCKVQPLGSPPETRIRDSWSQGKWHVWDRIAEHTAAAAAKKVISCFENSEILQRTDYCSGRA